MKRVILMIAMILAFLLSIVALRAEEITPPRITAPAFKVSYDELADVPYDLAKNFPAEVYYFWALAHNAKVSGHPTPATPPVFQEKISGFSPGGRIGRLRIGAGQYNQQTTNR